MTAKTPSFRALERKDLTAAKLRALLDYDPASGFFTWRERPKDAFVTESGWRKFNENYAGRVAGRVGRYRVAITVQGTKFNAHELAWLYVTGAWPVLEPDFVDGDPTNVSFSNLRDPVSDLI